MSRRVLFRGDGHGRRQFDTSVGLALDIGLTVKRDNFPHHHLHPHGIGVRGALIVVNDGPDSPAQQYVSGHPSIGARHCNTAALCLARFDATNLEVFGRAADIDSCRRLDDLLSVVISDEYFTFLISEPLALAHPERNLQQGLCKNFASLSNARTFSVIKL